MSKFTPDSEDHIPLGYTRDANGNELTYKDSNGYSREYTYDSNGNATHKKL